MWQRSAHHVARMPEVLPPFESQALLRGHTQRGPYLLDELLTTHQGVEDEN